VIDFVCNLCGRPNRRPEKTLDREKPSCDVCGSNVRTRGLLQALSMELFGVNLPVPDFPRIKSLRGLGTSDSPRYAELLSQKFDYRNTFYDREPRFDLAYPPTADAGQYDFLVSSDVLEHVAPPAENAFQNVATALKPTGLLVFTVPYSLDPAAVERFPDLYEFGLAQVGGRSVLVNRARTGELRATDDLVFHMGVTGPSLEMREYTESGLKTLLAGAGFTTVRIYGEDYPPFGIVRSESWSLPMAARKSAPGLNGEATRDVLEQWREQMELMKRLRGSFWFRVGMKLGLFGIGKPRT
jgi:SAM-dependent methyltransferase